MNKQVENHTNAKLNNWYKEVKTTYGVVGFATTKIEGNEITISYTENKVEKTWSMAFYPEYVTDNGLDYFFNVWAEQVR